MNGNSLEAFADRVASAWGPLTSELVADCKAHMKDLLMASAAEKWLGRLQCDLPDSRELNRDPVHGFLLLAHAEREGCYRSPHDHGRGWVIYGVQQGEMEVATYARLRDADGRVRLVRRDVCQVRSGEVRVYLPGDIHDTRCTQASVLYYRFTDRDLKKEEREGHVVTRYVERGGIWTVDAR